MIYDKPVLNIDLPLKSNILFRTLFMNWSLILFSLTPGSKQGQMNLCIVNVLNVELLNYTYEMTPNK